jgi:16S rRNA (guanine966-N2)-methyltransferase
MRVVAGQFRGRKLASAHSANIRPATDRVKEAIFNILQNKISLDGINVLDLFAGTGSLGIEAMSRGAAHGTFVDTSIQSLRILRSNISALGCEDRCTVLKTDAMRFIEQTAERFELIFADPPYAFRQTREIPNRVFSRELLKKKGFLIIEHNEAADFPESSLFRLLLIRKFGQTTVSFFSHHSEQL